MFVKYIGEGSVSSFDKIGDFFFGKTNNNLVVSKLEEGENNDLNNKNNNEIN